jgi:general secretion pathway protein K
MDWVDADDDITRLPFIQQENTGAESGYYEAQTPSYPCSNRPVNNLDELAAVKGITPEVLRRLRPFLTCLGDGRINVNAAPKLVIESLSEQIDGALAQMIVNQRKLKPFNTAAQLRDVPGMTDNIYRTIKDLVTARPADRYYRVTSRGNVEDRKCTLEAVLRRNTRAGNVDMILYRER